MAWRTIYIQSDQNIRIKNNSLILKAEEKEEVSLFLDDIDIIVIDNYKTNISLPTMIELSKRNIPLMFNSFSHDPIGILLPLSGHHKPLQNFNLQINLIEREKQKFQQQIIKQKIKNQRILMEFFGSKKESIEKMKYYESDVTQGDKRNREGSAAALYFKSLFGSSFVRHTDTAIDKSLNYGYKILASKISSAVIKYGLHPSLGFFHKTANNYFNLSYDLIEPFRPLIDWMTVKYNDSILNDDGETLNLVMRVKLTTVLDITVIIKNQKTKVRHAIDMVVKSIIAYLLSKNGELSLPELIFSDYEDNNNDDDEEEE